MKKCANRKHIKYMFMIMYVFNFEKRCKLDMEMARLGIDEVEIYTRFVHAACLYLDLSIVHA